MCSPHRSEIRLDGRQAVKSGIEPHLSEPVVVSHNKHNEERVRFMIQKGQTISMSRGRTAIEHDLRVYKPNNVDSSMTQYNRVLVNKLGDKTLAEYTNEYMKPYIDEYNKKQRRSDRKKSYDYATGYVEEQNRMQTTRQNYTAGQLAYEYVIQFGDRNSMSVKEVVEKPFFLEDVVGMFQEFVDEYEKLYPHMNIVLATVHMDEPNGTPHMHILVQPIGEGYKQGLSHQVSLTKALACDGFERADKKGDRLSLTRWQDDVKNRIMGRILFNHGYYRVLKDGEKNHLPVDVYKRVMMEKEEILKQAMMEANTIRDDAVKSAERIKTEAVDSRQELKNEIAKLENQREGLINGDYFVCSEEMPFREMSIEDIKEYRKQEYRKYKELLDGGIDENGNKQLGLTKLQEQKKLLEKYPEKVLETEAGIQAVQKERGRITNLIFNHMLQQMFFSFKSKLLDSLKQYLYEPICEAVGCILERKGVRLEEADKEWLRKNISFAVDNTIKYNDIGSAIDDHIDQILPTQPMIKKAVDEEMMKKRKR